MNGLVTVDIVSRVWAAEQKALAAIGKRHGEDYVFSTSVPSLGEWVYSVTPGAIPLGKLAVVGGRTGNNKTRAAQLLEISRQTLRTKLKEFHPEVDTEAGSPTVAPA